MEIVPVNQIVVGPNRQRRVFREDRLKSLAASISRLGLLNPIVVRDFVTFELVSGGRRLKSITQFIEGYHHNGTPVPAKHIPCTRITDLSEADRYEAELDENLQRDDITWQEKTDAVARLHFLRSNQKSNSGEKQTFTATAQELKGDEPVKAEDLTAVRNATILQPFLDDPDVKKAGTEREAMSIARRKLTQVFQEKLAKNFDISKANTPHTLVHGAMETVVIALPARTFDCIIVDPPYGIDAHKMAPMSGSQSGVKHEYEDTFENAYPIWQTIFVEGARVCKDLAHLYMFCDFRHWGIITSLAKGAGWDVWSTPIIWHKPGGGNLGDSTRGPRKSYETILFARRGDKRVTGVYLDVIVKAGIDTSLHGAAKPTDLYVDLLRRSCVAGDRVLDPCAGSCPILPAANRLRLIATAIEVSAIHYATGLQRLKEQ